MLPTLRRDHVSTSGTAPRAGAAALAYWVMPAALVCTAFQIYGSLIPLDLRPQPVGHALDRFVQLLSGPMTIVSRADFAVNVLLGFPLGLFWQAVVAGRRVVRSAVARMAAGAMIWLLCSGLAVTVEFAQMFFGGRESALSDCVAQSLGAAAGVLAWRLVPAAVWQPGVAGPSAWRQALTFYLAGMGIYALLPLDLTVSRSDLMDKVKAGRVRLVPFADWAAHPLAGLADSSFDVALWAGAMLLARLAYRGPTAGRAVRLLLLAVAFECAQFFVLSRVVDATDIVAAALGIGIGAALRFTSHDPAGREAGDGQCRGSGSRRALVVLLAACAMVAINTSPFDFVTTAALLHERLAILSPVPFASYATNTDLYLVTNLLRRCFEFGLFAFLLQWANDAPSPPVRWSSAGTAAMCACLALVIEVLQILLPASSVDWGDAVLAGSMGWAVGVWACHGRELRRMPAGASEAPRAMPPAVRTDLLADVDARKLWLAACLSTIALLAGLLGLGHLPQTPYNVRELLAPGGRPWSAVIVGASALVLFGAPALVARAAAGNRFGVLAARTLALLLGAPVILAALLYFGVDRESVDDLVGSPVLGVSPATESIGRLAALLVGVVWSLALGSALVNPMVRAGRRATGIGHLVVHGVWIVPLWHLVVVVGAGTDNLTELMADGGGVGSTLSLLTYGVLLGATAGGLFVACSARSRWRWTGATGVLVLSVCVGYALVAVGTEATLVKYGRVFSALQFLLSADRDAYVGTASLLLRFSLAHLGVTAAAVAGLLAAAAWVTRHVRKSAAPTAARRCTGWPRDWISVNGWVASKARRRMAQQASR